MSDFVLSTRTLPPGELSRALAAVFAPVGHRVEEYRGAWGTLAVTRAPHDIRPLVERDGWLSVLAGEPIIHGAGGAHGPDRGRDAAHALLARGDAAWDDAFDGPFAALALDTVHGGGRVVTDLFGWIPVFGAILPDGRVLGTHVDVVARAASVSDRLDPVSVTDWLAHATITHPHTLYAGVAELPPGSELGFAPDGRLTEERAYWRPREQAVFGSPREASAALREALSASVRVGIGESETAGLLLSGGEDSRAVLGAVPPGVRVRAFVYAEAENREIRSARRVADAYGAELVFGRRERDHYLGQFEVVSAMVGSQNEFIDAHGYGFHERLGMAQMPVVLGGFSSDALLKADNLSRADRRRIEAGRAPRYAPVGVPSVAELKPELLAAVAERRTAHRDGLASIRPNSADEWRWIFPFGMRRYAANLHGNRRLFRVHEPFMSNAVVKIAAAVPQRWKLDRALFLHAVRPFLKRAWWLPHSRNRFPYFGAGTNRVLRGPLGAARAAHAFLRGEHGANQESWPLWEKLVREPEMRRLEARYPMNESAIVDTLVDVRFDVDRWPAIRRLAALQLAYLTSNAGPVP